MAKPTIHFVYTVPLSGNVLRRAIDKAIRLARLKPLHRYGWDLFIPWKKPIRAPHSISYHLLHALRQHGRVRFYNMHERGAIELGPDDIFIGQPLPKGGFKYEGRPETDDHDSVTSATLRKYKGSKHKKFLIMPFANDPLLVSWARDLAKNYADYVILIGGEIWTKNWATTPFKEVPFEKVFRVDMGLDLNDYPQVKKQFNPPGERKYLYIGHTAWYKNTKELENIAAAIPNFKGSHLGAGIVKGWSKIADFADLTPEYMSNLAKEYDIFVNTSTADAQATTIVEQMSFGFVVACTPESGYDHPSLVALSTTDTAANVEKLQALQMADEQELIDLATKNRATVTTKHSWERFCNAIIGFMELV